MIHKILSVTSLFLLTITCINDSAQAGVLFRNRWQVIQTYRPAFRQQQYLVRSSTAVMRSTAPRLNYKDYGGVSSQLSLIRARYNYEDRLAKWENKKQQQIAKRIQRQKQLAEREAQRRAREQERLKRRQKAEQAKVQLASGSSGNITSQSASSRGSLAAPSQTGAQKKGFWNTLMQAIFGKKPNTP